MNIYDELICSDIRYLPFKVKAFNMVIAIESLYMKEFWNVIRDIETLIDNDGLIILSRGFKEEIRKRLLSEGYDVYHVYLRGLILTRLNNGEDFFATKEAKYIAPIIKVLYKMVRVKARDYTIAIKSSH